MKNVNSFIVPSNFLQREVHVDLYGIENLGVEANVDLLLVNDGQDLVKMNFPAVFKGVQAVKKRMIVAAFHAGVERKQEYGVSGIPDYLRRGSKAADHVAFVMEEFIPFFKNKFTSIQILNKYVAGFSLGGLMAFDMAMDFPMEFSAVGVFSGSFWWRSKDLKDGYKDERDRIMHAKIRGKSSNIHQRFYLQTGALDEKADRNNNGIIDSIDDTLDIIKELESIGFDASAQVKYVEIPDGKHDVATWKRAMPDFLEWLAIKK